jgi:hypothetical protein
MEVTAKDSPQRGVPWVHLPVTRTQLLFYGQKRFRPAAR